MTHHRSRGFAIIDLAILLVLCGALFVLLIGWAESHRAYSNKVACAANLHGLYRSMYTYSNSNRNKFPIWGNAQPKKGVRATGFAFRKRDGKKYKSDTKGLSNSTTASLWLMVKDGSSQTRQFVCPSSSDYADKLTDTKGNAVNIPDTYDFLKPENLSYSMINMYGSVQKRQWGANVRAERIIMSDNNNANGDAKGNLHDSTKADDLKLADLKGRENSSNHTGLTWTLTVRAKGQNLLFGDGHAEFTEDPYQGQAGDNVFAADTQATVNAEEKPARPFLEIVQAPDKNNGWANFRRDSMLLPLSGNGNKGKDSLSGLLLKKNQIKKKPDEQKDSK
ncbi:MAG: hypothetical protein R3236_08095 [Phycisphaeraceae bacterium]|nr:hypothetical protein [Phycisphaeraceae bacterium]